MGQLIAFVTLSPYLFTWRIKNRTLLAFANRVVGVFLGVCVRCVPWGVWLVCSLGHVVGVLPVVGVLLGACGWCAPWGVCSVCSLGRVYGVLLAFWM